MFFERFLQFLWLVSIRTTKKTCLKVHKDNVWWIWTASSDNILPGSTSSPGGQRGLGEGDWVLTACPLWSKEVIKNPKWSGLQNGIRHQEKWFHFLRWYTFVVCVVFCFFRFTNSSHCWIVRTHTPKRHSNTVSNKKVSFEVRYTTFFAINSLLPPLWSISGTMSLDTMLPLPRWPATRAWYDPLEHRRFFLPRDEHVKPLN